MTALAKEANHSVAEAMGHEMRKVPAGRLGTAQEFGAACAFLCSAHAGFITGQNLLIDGGAYPGDALGKRTRPVSKNACGKVRGNER